MADDALTRKDAEMGRLTREEIEELRPNDDAPMVADVRSDHMQQLCDLALRALSLESVREGAIPFEEWFKREYPLYFDASRAVRDTTLHDQLRKAWNAALQHAPARVAEGGGYCWLIERTDEGHLYYWTANPTSSLVGPWTTDPFRAVRFQRKEDA